MNVKIKDFDGDQYVDYIDVTISIPITVKEFAEAINIDSSIVIKALSAGGYTKQINDFLTEEEVRSVATEIEKRCVFRFRFKIDLDAFGEWKTVKVQIRKATIEIPVPIKFELFCSLAGLKEDTVLKAVCLYGNGIRFHESGMLTEEDVLSVAEKVIIEEAVVPRRSL